MTVLYGRISLSGQVSVHIATIMEVNKLSMKLLSYNCRGFNCYKSQYICKLLSMCDILYLQEHWLSEEQLCKLNSISSSHSAVGVCGFDKTEVLRGRPYGGCAVFWRSDSGFLVNVIDTNHSRVCALRLYNSDVNLLLINVYMPCDTNVNSYDDFCCILSVISNICESFPDALLILGGDFNVDFSRHTPHTTELERFCASLNVLPVVKHQASEVDFTYNFCMKRYSIIDHFILPKCVFDSSVEVVNAVHDADNLSDHNPLYLQIGMCYAVHHPFVTRTVTSKLAWYKASSDDVMNYRQCLQSNLGNITVPKEALACHNVQCCSTVHGLQLKNYSRDIMAACISAAQDSIPQTRSKDRAGANNRVAGWNEFVAPARNESIFWHNLWVECGRPHTGAVADCMRRTRAAYHYAVRYVRRRETAIIQENFAKSIIGNRNRDFWSEVKKIKSSAKFVSNNVDGVTDSNAIADMFADKYDDLYTSVPYDNTEMDVIVKHINSGVVEFNHDCVINFSDVEDAVRGLKPAKHDGYAGLSTDYFINGCDELYVHTTYCIVVLSYDCPWHCL